MEAVLRLVRKYTFIEAELVEGLQEYRPPFGPKTEVQCYVNDYTPQSIMPRAEPPLKMRTCYSGILDGRRNADGL